MYGSLRSQPLRPTLTAGGRRRGGPAPVAADEAAALLREVEAAVAHREEVRVLGVPSQGGDVLPLGPLAVELPQRQQRALALAEAVARILPVLRAGGAPPPSDGRGGRPALPPTPLCAATGSCSSSVTRVPSRSSAAQSSGGAPAAGTAGAAAGASASTMPCSSSSPPWARTAARSAGVTSLSSRCTSAGSSAMANLGGAGEVGVRDHHRATSARCTAPRSRTCGNPRCASRG